VNGPLAASTSTVAGGSLAIVVALARHGATTEAILFGVVALVAVAELVALVPWPRLVVCALAIAYAFAMASMLPVGDVDGVGTHQHGPEHSHAAAG
jgi:hypothetical protein